jgi:hypothetical protein
MNIKKYLVTEINNTAPGDRDAGFVVDLWTVQN